jgi:DNA recombination protein RmuC
MSLVFIAITLIAVFAGAGVAGAVLFPLLQRRVAELERLQGELIRLGQDLAIERERNESRAAAVSELEARLSEAHRREEERETLREGLAREKSELAARLAALQAERDGLQAALARREEEYAQAKEKAERLTERLEALSAAQSKLEEELRQERRQAEEKIALLEQARETMKREFRVLAEEVMRQHGETFTRQNREQIDGLLVPLREKLAEFQPSLQTAHTESEKERARLAEQIRHLSETSARMTRETENLTRALKGKVQTQGAWGEMLLSHILERSGLREGEEYEKQAPLRGEEGERLRPDVIVHLPNRQRLVIDSKVSLTAFESAVNAETDGERAAALARHCESIRRHIDGLAAKGYAHAAGEGPDYVIMFVPIEGALAAALEQDPAITAYAAERNVAIATPTTLMIALRTVANVWQVERRNRNAEEIAIRAGKAYDKLVGFLGDMEKLGERLAQAQKSYQDARKKLTEGRGSLTRQLEDLREMGARASKQIPSEWLEGESAPEGLIAGEASAS